MNKKQASTWRKRAAPGKFILTHAAKKTGAAPHLKKKKDFFFKKKCIFWEKPQFLGEKTQIVITR